MARRWRLCRRGAKRVSSNQCPFDTNATEHTSVVVSSASTTFALPFMYAMLNVDLAFRKLGDLVRPVADTEDVPIANAVGRIAAKTVTTPIDLPPFNASAMDGYAVDASGLDHAREKRFRVIDESLAGHPAKRALTNPGEAIRVYTGAVMPPGASAVVLQEDVTRQDAVIATKVPIRLEQHVRRRGHDVRAGEVLCHPGTRLSPFHLAWFAACGIGVVTATRRIRVGVFSTGDELAGHGTSLKNGQIYDSNRFAILALLQQKPVVGLDLGCLPDDQTTIANALDEASHRVDILVTSGGVSVGEADFVKNAVQETGHIDFWKIALKPGRPLAVGNIGKTLFFGLPGNPVSTIVTYLLFVAPAIDRLGGGQLTAPLSLPAVVEGRASHTVGRREYMRGALQTRGGQLVVAPTGDQGSNRLATFADANCLIVVDESTGNLRTGDPVRVIPLPSEAAHLMHESR